MDTKTDGQTKWLIERQSKRWTDKRTDRETNTDNRQIDRQGDLSDRQTDGETESWTEKRICIRTKSSSKKFFILFYFKFFKV